MSARVGGLALDSVSNVLYSLEIHELDGVDVLSVFAYEVGPGRSRKLWSVPWTSSYQKMALLVDTVDTLIVMGSKGALTESWRFHFDENGNFKQVGMRVDEGVLVSEPDHGSRKAVIMLGRQLFVRNVDHGGFFDGPILQEL